MLSIFIGLCALFLVISEYTIVIVNIIVVYQMLYYATLLKNGILVFDMLAGLQTEEQLFESYLQFYDQIHYYDYVSDELIKYLHELIFGQWFLFYNCYQ